MIDRILRAARLLTLGAAGWITAVVLWGLITGQTPVETPMLAVWIFIAGLIVQLTLRLVRKVTGWS